MSLKLFLVFALFVLYNQQVQSVVIGIDLGQEFFKVSLISPGKSFVIIENTMSHRKTPSAISFLNGKRNFEQEAISKRNRYPQNTFVFIQKFLGALATNEKYIEIAKQNYEEYIYHIDPERQTFNFELKDFQMGGNQSVILSVEEITAHLFSHIKTLAQKQANVGEIKDCVLTVPYYYNLDQRRALVQSAKLAGLYPLALVSENTAAALYYAVDRLDQNKTHTVIFYNLGSSGLQVTLAEFYTTNSTEKKSKQVETVRILAEAGSQEVSGLKFDQVLASIFADEQVNKFKKPDIRNNPRAMIRLLKEANKLKETLSANKDASFFVEGLVNDDDFKSHITRQAFEEASAHLFQHLTNPIDQVLKEGNRTLEDIDRLEILGGSVRIPKVQQILNQYLNGKELGAHLNGDEAMAFGAAFQAANLSLSFKVRPIYLIDGYNFEVKLKIRSLNETLPESEKYFKDFTVFPYRQRFNSRKSISFTYDQDLQFEFSQVDYNGNEQALSTINFTNISKIVEQHSQYGKPKLQFQLLLSSINPIEVDLAEAIFTEEKNIEYFEKVKVPLNETQELNQTETAQSENDNETTTQNDTSSQNTTNEQKDKKPQFTYQTVTKTKKKLTDHKFNLGYNQTYVGIRSLNDTEVKMLQMRMYKLENYEKQLRMNAQSKNNLESFIYKVQDLKIDEEFNKYLKESDQQKLYDLATENDDWLYSDEASASNHTEFDRRFKEMEKLVEGAIVRQIQAQKRPKAFFSAYQKLEELERNVEKVNKSMPWISIENQTQTLTSLDEIRQFLKQKEEEQQKKQLFEDPVITIEQIEKRLRRASDEFTKLRNIKDPKKQKKTSKTENNKKDPEFEKMFENLKKQFGDKMSDKDLRDLINRKAEEKKYEEILKQFEKKQQEKEQQKSGEQQNNNNSKENQQQEETTQQNGQNEQNSESKENKEENENSEQNSEDL